MKSLKHAMLLLLVISTVACFTEPVFNELQDVMVIEKNNFGLNNSVCENDTIILQNHTVLLGKNISKFWQPWLRETFPLCSSFLQQFQCLRKFNTTKNFHLYYKPCKSTCNRALQSCQMLHLFSDSTENTDFLGCHKYGNRRPCYQAKFPTERHSRCGYPLVTSTEPRNWVVQWSEVMYSESKNYGCSLACNSGLLLSKGVHKSVTYVMICVVLIGFMASLFSILSFAIDWQAQKRYPAFILFILNVCFLFCISGWILQFFFKNMACDKRNEKRVGEPRLATSLPCVISFVLIYFSSIAISCWFVILTYSWKISFKKLASKDTRISTRVKYFHMIAWSIPTLFTMIVTLSGNIDGDETTDICFVGLKNKRAPLFLVILPYSFALVLGEAFLISGILELYKLRADCRSFLVPKATLNITYTLYRLIAYGLVTFGAVVIAVAPLIYTNLTEARWKEEFVEYVRCSISPSQSQSRPCILPTHHKLLFFYFQMFGLLANCLITSSWTWTRATIKTWMKLWRRYRKADVQFMAQRSWYMNLKKKKIRPFVPPVNHEHPLTSRLPDEHSRNDNRRRNTVDTCSSFTKLLRELTKGRSVGHAEPSAMRGKQKEDIRSVVSLFSSRRGSKLSLASFVCEENSSMKSQSPSMFQSFGHLTRGCRPIGDVSAKGLSTNLAVEFNGGKISKNEANMSLEQLQFVRDVCTPLSTVHKKNIVADCIPYDLSSFKNF